MSHTAQAGKRSYHLEGFYSLYKKNNYHVNKKTAAQPVNNFPCIRQVSNDLNIDEYFLLDVDNANHLMEVFSSVSEELLHLKICLKLVKLFHLPTEQSASQHP